MSEIRTETRGPYCWIVFPDGTKRGTVFDVTIYDDVIETPFGPFNRGWVMSYPRSITIPAPPSPPRRTLLDRLFNRKAAPTS